MEMWGGATFDVAMRFLLEDPWVRLRRLRELIPNICFQMLLRASQCGRIHRVIPTTSCREFIRESAAQGIDIFRIFDSLNWLPNMKIAMEAVQKTGKICEAAICYTGDILDPQRDKYPLRYYVERAKEARTGWARISSASRIWPGSADRTQREAREGSARGSRLCRFTFHTHDTSGLNAASILKASEAGADVADAAAASMSGTTSQPNLNSVVAALAHTPARLSTRPGRAERIFRLLGSRAHLLQALRQCAAHRNCRVYVHECRAGSTPI